MSQVSADGLSVHDGGPLARPVVWRDVDLRPESDLFDDLDLTDGEALEAAVLGLLGDRRERAGIVAHLTPLMPRAARRRQGALEPATVQAGCMLLMAAGERLVAPVASVVEAASEGPLVLRHPAAGSAGSDLWSCWFGLDVDVATGDLLAPGDAIGTAAVADDGDPLGSSVQVQVHTGPVGDPRQWVRPSELSADGVLDGQLDPLSLLGIPDAHAGVARLRAVDVVAMRDMRLARSQRAYYRRPPKLVRGRDVWMYDENGLAYLDSINNVTHVGHAEPRVVAAASRQLHKLNTNSRFLYEGMATYAQRLVATLPAPLEVVFLVCTGSEANDLALRISRQVTGRQDVVVIDGAYHGNTAAVMGISPNRYKGSGGRGRPDTTHEVATPDLYRGAYGKDDPQAGMRYGQDAADVIRGLVAQDRAPAAFIAESLMGTAGNIRLPEGFLATAFAAARAEGALCISDEVQVGVGRLGTHFWGFESHGVVPDIVTMGKPLGNGHPLAVVVTTREIADAFDDGVRYFNTFGGNPVSCAIGTAVLDIVEDDGLQANALDVGGYMLEELRSLAGRHELVGDVRGHGLYLGVELVRDRATKEPAVSEALAVTEALKDDGVLTYPTGSRDNVLKIKPPMTFRREHVDLYVEALDRALSTTSPVAP